MQLSKMKLLIKSIFLKLIPFEFEHLLYSQHCREDLKIIET